MKSRPWPLVLLAVGQFLSPVMNTLINAWLEKISPATYFLTFIEHRSIWAIMDYLVLDILSGLAIWYMKVWLYPIFLFAQVWTLGHNLYVWWVNPYGSQTAAVAIVAICLVNIIVVSYYLLPKVRAFFFNQRLRWWEAKPRYSVGVRAQIEKEGTRDDCLLKDLSEGGVFLDQGPPLNQGDVIQIHFELLGVAFDQKGLVVHTHQREARMCYGVQFQDLDSEKHKRIVQATQALQLLGKTAGNRTPDPWTKSLWVWLRTLFTTGHGLIPDIELPKKKD